ncbi:uncharacterized protein NECHADRAFT_83260 [Fusarium vanettenii 77-13-4]|uniref:NmrA-like domain-containing protein n=1 Tax=Fusarium vanettenii (strain ATCC MYA-4622 / CBS 123669 / FGSC 9596 / NRRL 45880 / 77-13-4) TaxID=660122 RepID=C7Z3I4_FUSV7|nr:uncharacterized protein NECHADRAFT_83260 [Fusarium vanettenii 77-13-4]EEU41141.1 hypothetical protein NECHADRAFT_83260 [Fusarium vanettenii 77-13-4]
MARQIKNVALAGPNGNVGSNILKALIEANVFNITVLLREQASAFPDGITAKVVDFTSVDSLAEAVKGQDAVIDATVGPNPRVSLNLIEASLASQIYHFVPSEFTSDPNDVKTRALPLFQGKRTVHEYIQKLGREEKITFTILSTGAFLDWNLNNGFMFIDLANKEINLMNDGEIVIPWTLLPVAGKATVNALLRTDETVNKTCYVYNIQKSQKELAELAKEALGDDGWQT